MTSSATVQSVQTRDKDLPTHLLKLPSGPLFKLDDYRMNDDDDSDFANLIPGVRRLRHDRINVYQQISGAHLGHPFFEKDLPLNVVMVDCSDVAREAEFDAWYSQSHVPVLLQIPGYVSAARFKLFEHPVLEWLGMGPKYLALYELADLECIPSLADPDQMRPEATAEFARWTSYAGPMVENMSWNIYRPLARHWPA